MAIVAERFPPVGKDDRKSFEITYPKKELWALLRSLFQLI
jgi:hypothetical protein